MGPDRTFIQFADGIKSHCLPVERRKRCLSTSQTVFLCLFHSSFRTEDLVYIISNRILFDFCRINKVINFAFYFRDKDEVERHHRSFKFFFRHYIHVCESTQKLMSFEQKANMKCKNPPINVLSA